VTNLFHDRTLKCLCCDSEFTFTADEQIYFRSKRFGNEPKHCKLCRAKRLNQKPRPEARVTCAKCGLETTVPFLPTQGRPFCVVPA